jgi:uncharacterized protein (TIGR00369 family)
VIDPRVAASFARQGLMATLGARLLDAHDGTARIEAPVTAAVSQQQGLAHAGLPFSIGDSAAGYAALTLLPAEREVVTVEMKVNLVAPGRGGRLVATGRVVRAGRRILVVTAEVADDAGRPVAILQGTMMPVDASPA